MPGGLELDPAILDPGPLATRGQVHTDSGTNIARVIGLTPAAFDPVTGPVFFGLNVTGPAAPFFMTPTQSTAILNLFTPTLQGLVPLSGGGTTNFLRADGTWAVPPGTGGGADWAAVLAIGHVSGANNAHIDTGQILSFGVEGSLPPTGSIRSSTDMTLRAVGSFEAISTATMQMQTLGNIPFKVVTNGVERLEIQGDGAWQFQGSTGTSGQFLTSAGSTSTPVWATFALTMLPSQAADTFLGRLAGSGTPTAQLLSDIDSASLVYDATSHTFQVAAASGGDITKAQNSNTYTINNDAVTYAKIQNVVANNRFLGRISGAGGDVEELTGTQATTLLDNFTSALKGLAPASGGGTTNFLRADGSWAVPVDTNTGHQLRNNGGALTQRAAMNFITGAAVGNINFTLTDDAGGGETEITGTLVSQAAKSVIANATNASAVPTALAGSAAFQHLRVNSGNTGLEWSVFTSGDFPAAVVPLTALATAGALTVIANATNATATPTAVASSADDTVFRRTSSTLNWGGLTVGMAANDLWTYAKIQNVVNNNRFLGRVSGAGGDIEELTGTQATTLLDNFTSTLKGLAPLSGGGTTNFLRADGTWAAPPGASPGHVVKNNGTPLTQRAGLNFNDSTHIFLTATDDAGNNESDVTPALQLGATFSWTGAHDFTGAVAFTVGVSSDVSVASTTGGLWLSAGHTPVVSPSVSNGDVLINAANGAGLFARATPATNVGLSTVEVGADGDIALNAGSGVAIVAGSSATGFPVTSVTTGNVEILADNAVNITSETANVTIASGADVNISSVGGVFIPSPLETGDITVTGGAFLTNVISPAALAAQTNNFNPTGFSTATTIRITLTGAQNLTGIIASANKVIQLVNADTADNLTLIHDNSLAPATSSTAANRFLLAGNTNRVLLPQAMVKLWYDNTSARWRADYLV